MSYVESVTVSTTVECLYFEMSLIVFFVLFFQIEKIILLLLASIALKACC